MRQEQQEILYLLVLAGEVADECVGRVANIVGTDAESVHKELDSLVRAGAVRGGHSLYGLTTMYLDAACSWAGCGGVTPPTHEGYRKMRSCVLSRRYDTVMGKRVRLLDMGAVLRMLLVRLPERQRQLLLDTADPALLCCLRSEEVC